MKHHHAKKGGHGHPHDFHTTFGGAFGHKIRHAAKEGFSRQGLFGLQFALDAINPFFWMNAAMDARAVAKRNRGILRHDLKKPLMTTSARMFESGAMKDPKLRGLFARTDAQLTGHEMFAAKLERTMMSRLERIEKEKKNKDAGDDPDALKKHGIPDSNRLSKEQIGTFLDYMREEKEAVAGFRSLRDRLRALHAQKNKKDFGDEFEKLASDFEKFRKKDDALRKRREGGDAGVILNGMLEAEAIIKHIEK